MFIYINILGEWIELSDNDKINNMSIEQFCLITTNLQNLNNDFYEIIIKDIKDGQFFNKHYIIHKSCIQLNYVEKC